MQLKDLYFGGRNVEGEVGIEIEVEGKMPDMYELMELREEVEHFWMNEHDGSLRGSSTEFVLKQPILRRQVNTALGVLAVGWDELGGEIVPSVRTGVHVHVNVRDLTMKQTFIFMILFILFEDVLVRYCGEDRTGNLFCRRSSDAESYIDALMAAIYNNSIDGLYTDDLRYAAMNPKALREYGSLEFRCLKTPENIMDIELWVNMLLSLKDAAQRIDDPVQLIENISVEGGDTLAKKVFGDFRHFLPVTDWTLEIFKTLRLVQPAVYARDWTKPDPNPVILETELPQDAHEAWDRGGILTPREVVEYGF